MFVKVWWRINEPTFHYNRHEVTRRKSVGLRAFVIFVSSGMTGLSAGASVHRSEQIIEKSSHSDIAADLHPGSSPSTRLTISQRRVEARCAYNNGVFEAKEDTLSS
jgi:hypothetical protein